MNQPLVSIIVPAYNVERYIEECIDSLLNQSYKNIEIIVLDDASTDATRYLMRQYESHIQIIENDTNQGQGARRNQGIKLAKGEYIYFVDSDDWIEPNAIERLVKQAEAEKLDLVRFNGAAFYEGGSAPKEEGNYDFSHVLKDKAVYTGEELLEKNRKSYSASPCLYLVKKEVIDQHNLFFLEGVLHEDEYFTTRLFVSVESMSYLNEALYHRRYRLASTMTENTDTHKLKSFDSYLKVFKALEIEYESKKMNPLQKTFIKRQLLSIYNGLKESPVLPENKRKLRGLESITLIDKVYLILSKVNHRINKK
ncbi:glycosyltransferase [Alkalibacterium sp. m-11]|uniref:Glycosyltransferase n=1 Tax=Alkalibacterium indicireducens TaxID=398758 RepID=A0ABP3KR26_9LACT